MVHRGPNDRGTYVETASRSASGASASSTSRRAPAVRERTGDVWAIQNGELYNHEALHGMLAEDGHTFAAAATPRSCRTCTSASVTRSRAPSAATSRSPSGTGAGTERCSRATGGGQAAVLRRVGRPRRLRVGAEEPPRQRSRRGDSRPRGRLLFLTFGYVPGPDAAQRRPQGGARRDPDDRRRRRAAEGTGLIPCRPCRTSHCARTSTASSSWRRSKTRCASG